MLGPIIIPVPIILGPVSETAWMNAVAVLTIVGGVYGVWRGIRRFVRMAEAAHTGRSIADA